MNLTLRRLLPGLVIMLIAACASDGQQEGAALQPAVQTTSIGTGALRAIYPARNIHEVSGDVSFRFEHDGLVDVYEILGGKFPPGTSLLTASVGGELPSTASGSLLRWSADLAPGIYEGPGTYTIDGKVAPKLAEQSSLRSSVYLTVTGPEAGEGGVATFNVLNQPCTFTYEQDATAGEVACPELGLDLDPSRTISWTWTWTRLASTDPVPS